MAAVGSTDAALAREQVAGTSPRLKARVAGVFYLVTIVAGLFAEVFVRGKLIVSGDALATAHNVVGAENLYRYGFAADLVGTAGYIVVTLLLYDLLKPVNRSLSLLAAFFSLVGCAIGGLASLGQLGALFFLGGAHYLSAFNSVQLQAMAYLSIKFHAQGYLVGLVFFGFYCLLIGYLVFKSTFIPRIIGVLMAIAGGGWLINSFASFVAPDLNFTLAAITGIGELALTLWLLVMGVDAEKWREVARRSASALSATENAEA